MFGKIHNFLIKIIVGKKSVIMNTNFEGQFTIRRQYNGLICNNTISNEKGGEQKCL